MRLVAMWFVVLLFIIFVVSCARQGIKTEQTNNTQIKVDLLFEHDGVRVYRFVDCDKFHYFTTRGETITTQSKQVGKTRIRWEENL